MRNFFYGSPDLNPDLNSNINPTNPNHAGDQSGAQARQQISLGTRSPAVGQVVKKSIVEMDLTQQRPSQVDRLFLHY